MSHLIIITSTSIQKLHVLLLFMVKNSNSLQALSKLYQALSILKWEKMIQKCAKDSPDISSASVRHLELRSITCRFLHTIDRLHKNVTSVIQHRMKRSFEETISRIWEGFQFKLETPSENWSKQVGKPLIGASFGVIISNFMDFNLSK